MNKHPQLAARERTLSEADARLSEGLHGTQDCVSGVLKMQLEPLTLCEAPLNRSNIEALLEQMLQRDNFSIFLQKSNSQYEVWKNYLRSSSKCHAISEDGDGLRIEFIGSSAEKEVIRSYVDMSKHIRGSFIPHFYFFGDKPEESFWRLYVNRYLDKEQQEDYPISLIYDENDEQMETMTFDSATYVASHELLICSRDFNRMNKCEKNSLFDASDPSNLTPLSVEGHEVFLRVTFFSDGVLGVPLPAETHKVSDDAPDKIESQSARFISTEGTTLSVEGITDFSSISRAVSSCKEVASVVCSEDTNIGTSRLLHVPTKSYLQVPVPRDRDVVFNSVSDINAHHKDTLIMMNGIERTDVGEKPISFAYSPTLNRFITFDGQLDIAQFQQTGYNPRNKDFLAVKFQPSKQTELEVLKKNETGDYEKTNYDGYQTLSWGDNPLIAVRENGKWKVTYDLSSTDFISITTPTGQTHTYR